MFFISARDVIFDKVNYKTSRPSLYNNKEIESQNLNTRRTRIDPLLEISNKLSIGVKHKQTTAEGKN